MLSGFRAPKVRIIGCDVAGRVEAVAGDVRAFQPGDEVYGDLCGSGFGAFAEYACAPETNLAHKPAGMTFEQAAAIPQAGMLAVQGLIDVGRRGGDILLSMAKLETIEKKIRALSPEELAEFRRWFTRFDAAAWDRRLELDVTVGKLDALADQALRDHAGA